MAVIRLHSVGGSLLPCDAVSARVLLSCVGVSCLPCSSFYLYSPRLVARGFALKITGSVDDLV